MRAIEIARGDPCHQSVVGLARSAGNGQVYATILAEYAFSPKIAVFRPKTPVFRRF